MSENLKIRLDPASGDTQQDRLNRPSDPVSSGDLAPIDEAESQMRKALGLLGETPRHRLDSERMEQPSRLGDRFGGGLHRRRFVQDGDIPVTVLRRDQGHEAPAHRGNASAAPPTSSRLQRTEAALAAETAAREKAERSLVETQSVVRDLQTKIGHAELAKNEAIETLRLEREAIVQLRADVEARDSRLQDTLEQVGLGEHNAHVYQEQLVSERQLRKAAEKGLHAAEIARDAAEELVRTLSRDSAALVQAPEPACRQPESIRRPRVVAEPEIVVAADTRRGRSAQVSKPEPEPVKWWLNTKPAGKKR